MFKEIVAISKNYAIVKIDNMVNDDLLNLNVVFEEENKKILGEIEEVNNNEVKIYTAIKQKKTSEFADKEYSNDFAANIMKVINSRKKDNMNENLKMM